MHDAGYELGILMVGMALSSRGTRIFPDSRDTKIFPDSRGTIDVFADSVGARAFVDSRGTRGLWEG